MEKIRDRREIEELAFKIAGISSNPDVFPPNVAIEVTLYPKDYLMMIYNIAGGIDLNNTKPSDEFTYNSMSGIKFKIKRDNGK